MALINGINRQINAPRTPFLAAALGPGPGPQSLTNRLMPPIKRECYELFENDEKCRKSCELWGPLGSTVIDGQRLENFAGQLLSFLRGPSSPRVASGIRRCQFYGTHRLSFLRDPCRPRLSQKGAECETVLQRGWTSHL